MHTTSAENFAALSDSSGAVCGDSDDGDSGSGGGGGGGNLLLLLSKLHKRTKQGESVAREQLAIARLLSSPG